MQWRLHSLLGAAALFIIADVRHVSAVAVATVCSISAAFEKRRACRRQR